MLTQRGQIVFSYTQRKRSRCVIKGKLEEGGKSEKKRGTYSVMPLKNFSSAKYGKDCV